MNGSLVPANTKKSTLVMGFLRPIPDIPILASGIIISVILLAVVQNAETWLMLIFCIPMLISLVLVLPIPNYHNTLCALQSIWNFYNGRRNYIWKGWCIYDEYKNDK